MLKEICTLVTFLIAGAAMAAVEVNKATEADLDSLNGVGPATTQLILKERKKSEFKDWADLMSRVKGIGDVRATKLSAAGLTVSGTSYKERPSKGVAKANQDKAQVMTPTAVKPSDKKPGSEKSAEPAAASK